MAFDVVASSLVNELPLKEILENVILLSKECGKIITDYYARQLEPHGGESDNVVYSIKEDNPADLVTCYDTMIENIIRKRLDEKYPLFGFLGEEAGILSVSFDSSRFPYWVVDPIDGTANFIQKFPYCCISIALVFQGQSIVAVVYNPVQNQLWSAAIGQGAYYNENRRLDLSHNQKKNLKEVFVSTEIGSFEWQIDEPLKSLLWNQRKTLASVPVRGLRCLGSSALDLCHLAMGHFDLYYQYGMHAWDIAAGLLVAREAGAVIENLFPSKDHNSGFRLHTRDILVAANNDLMSTWKKLIIDDHSLVITGDAFSPDILP